MSTPPFSIQEAHRWFAVEFNNLAWDLLESKSRTKEENERMVHVAHASTFHWLEVGTPLNHLRAQCLLTTVYSSLGFADSAFRHAIKCLTLSEEIGDQQTPFDLASVSGCVSLAYACMGDKKQADMYRGKAVSIAEMLDLEEKSVFESIFLGTSTSSLE